MVSLKLDTSDLQSQEKLFIPNISDEVKDANTAVSGGRAVNFPSSSRHVSQAPAPALPGTMSAPPSVSNNQTNTERDEFGSHRMLKIDKVGKQPPSDISCPLEAYYSPFLTAVNAMENVNPSVDAGAQYSGDTEDSFVESRRAKALFWALFQVYGKSDTSILSKCIT